MILTDREKEIIKLVSKGYSNIAIAEKLVVSEHTIKCHLHQIYNKIPMGKEYSPRTKIASMYYEGEIK